ELHGLRWRFDCEKNGKSCKIYCCLGRKAPAAGRKAQPAAVVLLFAVCFLRNAQAGLRFA
ncbi:hypothetical protein A2U01_0092291, partial [Trifolium medium]|nr:hypothetical protein [Trifolium medium]